MTNSRSIASTSRLLAIAVAVAAVLGAGRVAEAGRKRVVVLDFEGPKGEKFHEDLVRLIKKTHTVVPTEKWSGAADQLGAGTLSDRDVKKVARKLKIDAIVQGKIEKRRDEFIIRLKLRAGKSGELIGDSIDTKAEGPRIDGRAQKDLKDELVGKIDDIESNHDGAGGDDADDDPPARRPARQAKGDDADDRPTRKAARAETRAEKDEEDDDKPAARKTARKGAKKDDDADDDRSARRSKFAGRSDDERGSDKVGKPRKGEPKAEAEDDDDKLPPKKGAKAAAKSDRADKAEAEDDDDKLPPKKGAKAAAKPDRADKAEADDEDKLPPKKSAGKAGPEDAKVAAREPAKEPAKKPAARSGEDDDDKLPPKKPAAKAGGDDARVAAREPAKKPAARSGEDDDDKLPPRKSAGKSGAGDSARRGKPRKVASREDDDAEAEAELSAAPLDAAAALSPGERFLDAALGMSVTMRRLTFGVSKGLRATPSGYSGVPAPGALLDVTVYPLAFGHTTRGIMKDFGLELLYDRVLSLNSKVTLPEGMGTATYSTLETRFSAAAVFRHSLGRSPNALVVLGSLGYHRQEFNIHGKIELPDVKYTMFAPGAGLRFPVFSKLTLAADARLLLPTDTGQIQQQDQYGTATVVGFDGSAGADYRITPNIFVRAAARFEVIRFKFRGNGAQSNARDGNPMTQDVFGAHDNYIGGFLTAGYLY